MSSPSNQRANAGSTAGLLQEVGWCLLGIIVFTVLLYWDLFPVEVTPTRVVGSVLIGGVLGFGSVMLAHTTERIRALWNDEKYKFFAMFTLAIGVQVFLRIAPAWTILTVLTMFIVAIPTRFVLYIYTRSKYDD
jgi:hypothetical protein